jgi:hypothetical protein
MKRYAKEIRTNYALRSDSASIEELPWYGEKGNVREYLKEINKDKKVGSSIGLCLVLDNGKFSDHRAIGSGIHAFSTRDDYRLRCPSWFIQQIS